VLRYVRGRHRSTRKRVPVTARLRAFKSWPPSVKNDFYNDNIDVGAVGSDTTGTMGRHMAVFQYPQGGLIGAQSELLVIYSAAHKKN
jgi:hypothetical protein